MDTIGGASTCSNRDRGPPRGGTPPTPPCVRVRTRRFGWLSGLGSQYWLQHCRAVGIPPRRKRFGPSPRGRRDFIPTLLRKGQQTLDIRPLVVHEIQALLAPPFDPRWGPFRPSRLSRSHRTLAVSLLSDEWLARQTDAVTTPSADFCQSIRRPSDPLSLDFGTDTADLPR